MEKNEIEEYIKKLKELEKELNSEEMTDTNFISELDDLLGKLHTEIKTDFMSNPTVLNVKFKKLHPDCVTPQYSKDGDAGMDLTITEIVKEDKYKITYGFGLSIEIPPNYVGLLFPRSSVEKYTLTLSNCVGVIDSGYRGEIKATFKKSFEEGEVFYTKGERAAQIIILPYPKIKFIESDSLSDTNRGNGGFGSTGS
jgi:dUTP pyrophosphatase